MTRLSAFLVSTALFVLGSLLSGCASSPDIEPNKTVWSRADLETDLDAWLAWTRSTHPAFEQRVDQGEFERRLKQVREGLRDGMETSQAWYLFAQLNLILKDAHLGLELPAIDPDLDSWRVEIENLHAYLPVRGADEKRQEIVAVDDIPVPEMIARTLPLIRGETDALRQRILELRFRELVMLNIDADAPAKVRLKSGDGAESVVSEISSAGSESGSNAFSLQFLNSTAIMKIDTFEKERDAEFAGFVDESFARIAFEKPRDLSLTCEVMVAARMKCQTGC